jgi:hypothetical protein
MIIDPARPVNLADPDVVVLVRHLIDTADDLASYLANSPVI